MVRLYDMHHVKEGVQWVSNPHKLSTEKIKELKQQRNKVVLETAFLGMEELAVVYKIGEDTGIPVVQREYTLRNCPFEGMFNLNDGEYIGDKAGLCSWLDSLFERVASETDQSIADSIALM